MNPDYLPSISKKLQGTKNLRPCGALQNRKVLFFWRQWPPLIATSCLTQRRRHTPTNSHHAREEEQQEEDQRQRECRFPLSSQRRREHGPALSRRAFRVREDSRRFAAAVSIQHVPPDDRRRARDCTRRVPRLTHRVPPEPNTGLSRAAQGRARGQGRRQQGLHRGQLRRRREALHSRHRERPDRSRFVPFTECPPASSPEPACDPAFT